MNEPDVNIIPDDDPTDVLKFSKAAEKCAQYEADFALDMLKHLEASTDETKVVSPLGFYEVPTMIANADDDEVAPEIIGHLTQGNAADLDALNEYNRIMIKVLPNLDKSVTLFNNNAVAYQQGLTFDENYFSRLNSNFLPEEIVYNLADGNMHLLINEWAARTTNNKILNFLEEPIASHLVLLNSNYMKGDWMYAFDEHVDVGSFENIDKTYTNVPYLLLGDQFPSFYENGIKGVEFPLGNGNFSFVAMMPSDKDEDLSVMVEKLNSDELNRLLEKKTTKFIKFQFPCFDITSDTFNYREMLQSMGFVKLFSSPIVGLLKGSDAQFGAVLQKSTISVTRDGMEAASVTSGTLSGSPGVFPEYSDDIKFYFDRPFVFVVRENSTGAILYAGQVKSLPNYEEEWW